MIKHYYVLLLLCFGCSSNEADLKQKINYLHPITFQPETYVCYRSPSGIKIDGKMDEPEWQKAEWTKPFVDIEGELQPDPPLLTQAKMLWDDTYFYFAAKMEEPHVWATLTERDAIMYHNDDFEIFLDPDGDGHNYYEFEMNANNAIWDLLMFKPYRVNDGLTHYLMNWQIKDVLHAVYIDGSLNDPSDEDRFWSVEVAIPWEVLKELAPNRQPAKPGDQWRVNFSRVDWQMEVKNRKYHKILDPEEDYKKPLPESNWVWSPSGRVNMHQVETWGYVQFSDKIAGDETEAFAENPEEKIKWALWRIIFPTDRIQRKK